MSKTPKINSHCHLAVAEMIYYVGRALLRGGGRKKETETERERQRKSQRQRDRERDRKRQRQTKRQTKRQR